MIASELETAGFARITDCVARSEVDAYIAELDRCLLTHPGSIRARGDIFGIRNLLEAVPQTIALLASAKLRAAVTSVLGEHARIVRALFFDKPVRANWTVPWHQDQFVALRERIDHPDFTAWTMQDRCTSP